LRQEEVTAEIVELAAAVRRADHRGKNYIALTPAEI
jgi:hypothetical protein